MWLQTVFTGLLPLLSLLSIEPYVSLKCKFMKLENLLRKKVLLFLITRVDQTPYWKVHWLMSCESYPSMTYCSFLFFIILDCTGTSWSGKLYYLFVHLEGLCNCFGYKVLQHTSADVLDVMSLSKV